MEIDRKIKVEGPNMMMKKSRKSEAGGPKIEKNGGRGCLPKSKKHEVGKNRGGAEIVDFCGKWEPRWSPKTKKNR